MTVRDSALLLSQNLASIKPYFKLRGMTERRFTALLYTMEDKRIEPSELIICYDLIKRNTGAFSYFRGNTQLALSALLALKGNPAELLERIKQVYLLLKASGFTASNYLVLAAYQIAARVEEADYSTVAGIAREYYDGMRREHFLTTGYDDHIFCAALAVSGIQPQQGIQRMERVYSGLKPYFMAGSGLQTLSHVLTLGGQSESVINRLLELKNQLAYKGFRMNRRDLMPSLGMLTLLPQAPEDIARDIADGVSFLRTQSWFGYFSAGKHELTVLCSGLIARANMQEILSGTLDSALSTSIINIILAQQAAMIAASAGSASAAAASSSN